MDALRSHPFFKDLNWNTLWTGEVPALRPGIFLRAPQTNGFAGSWGSLGFGANGYPRDELSDDEDDGDDDEYFRKLENGELEAERARQRGSKTAEELGREWQLKAQSKFHPICRVHLTKCIVLQ